ncbi:MAG: M15 family metallopeptidase, partial [Lutibacter sp.]
VSAYRSFQRQKKIFESKYNRFTQQGLTPKDAIEKIIEYTTIPGTSRHHWGTEIDIVDANGKILKPSLQVKNYETNGVYNKLKIWMNANSERYGFYLVYTNNVNRAGFNYEPWHYTYHQISKKYLNYFINHCLFNLKQNKIFGNQYLKPQFLKKYSQKYLKGINNKLK